MLGDKALGRGRFVDRKARGGMTLYVDGFSQTEMCF